jgi:phosphoribosylaminoimidazolecarboxamide formyltransferase / IMP cyclohydrolase
MATALLSLSNKTGLPELARGLSKLGWSLLASGGTAAAIRTAGLVVEEIADYTTSPEILGGRVKTLHPAVHGGILARDTAEDMVDLEHIHARMIDLVVVNLYPFQETIQREGIQIDEAIENIDIGGVALIRAAAKNFQRVAVLTDPKDYPAILSEIEEHGQVSLDSRQKLALKAFQHTVRYDSAIAAYLADSYAEGDITAETPTWLSGFPYTELRYGENPHQQARLYLLNPPAGPLGGEVLQGKALSYNNLLDLDAAWRAAVCFERPSIAIVKHLSPCGIASSDNLADAFRLALSSDPVSAYGGVIAANRTLDGETVEALGNLFVECIIAPDFTPDAAERLAKKKNCRLVRAPDMALKPNFEIRSVNQGLLWQTRDFGDPAQASEWQVVSQRQPTAEEREVLKFAWKACMHVKSNAIVLAKGEATVGIGGGQPNRVDCVRIAVVRAGERAAGSILASDAFFPFRDSVDIASRAGVTAIIHPGGSLRDSESIEAANQANIAMVTTGIRHFRH